jgi:hypothetical protein
VIVALSIVVRGTVVHVTVDVARVLVVPVGAAIVIVGVVAQFPVPPNVIPVTAPVEFTTAVFVIVDAHHPPLKVTTGGVVAEYPVPHWVTVTTKAFVPVRVVPVIVAAAVFPIVPPPGVPHCPSATR